MDQQADPLVIVLPNRDDEDSKGIDSMRDLEKGRARKFRAVPLSRAIRTRYTTYAHICLYSFPEEREWPRVNKTALPELRDLEAEPGIEVTCLDYDTSGHLPLDVEGYRDLLARIEEAPLKWKPSYIWKTRSGARLLFIHERLAPERAEGWHCFLREHYEAHGIPCDPKAWEWNRPHALPWVVRDGAPLDPDQVWEFEPLGPLPDFPERPVPLRLNARTLRADQPEALDAAALVWKDADSSGKLTEWGAWAKERMTGRDAKIAWDVPTLEAKTRNPTLFAWAGSLVSMLYGFNDTSPEHVYGVLAPTVEANLRDGLYQEVWRAVCYCWSREEAQAKETALARRGFVEKFRDEVRGWAPNAPESEEEFTDWVRERLVVVHDSSYYVLREDGRYGPQPVKHPALISALRKSGLVGEDRVLKRLARVNDKGKEEPLRCQDILDKWSQPVDEVILQGGAKLGGVLEGDHLQILAVTTFARRTDITPERSAWCEGWFEAWFGEHRPTVESWFSAALAFEEGPVCALSLQSAGGSGKNLAMAALARTITSKTFSPAKQVIGHFQPKLGKTPFVHVDETWPFEKGIHAAFRGLIGTYTQSVNRKNVHEADIRTCPRILMTANKNNLVEVLFGDRDMTQTEHEATAERVIHLRLGDEGKKWLEANGGMQAATEKLESDEIAKHLLYLWRSVPRSRVGRFLLVGNPRDPFLGSLAFKGVAVLGEVLVRMVESGKLTGATRVRAELVLDYMDTQLLSDRARGYNLITLGRDLRGFLKADRTLDLQKLRNYSLTSGMKAPKLASLVKADE